MKTVCLFICLFIANTFFGQDVATKLSLGIKKLENDEQFKHALLSLYVVDGKTSKVVFEKNAQIGLAPASCQKVITSVSAFEMLGKEYKYKTELRYFGVIKDLVLSRNLYLAGYGDPTLGSWRYSNTGEVFVMKHWMNVLQQKKITVINNFFIADDSSFSSQLIPGGWFAELLAGAFFVEYIFGWRGIGKITVDALEKLDYPIVMGSVLISACIFILINMLADVLYAVVDPRVKS